MKMNWAVIAALLFSLSACGKHEEPAKNESKKSAEQKTPAATNAAKPVNTYCMVMGKHEIDPAVTITHEGITYGFCCEDCIPKFKKDPAKYIAMYETREKKTPAEQKKM